MAARDTLVLCYHAVSQTWPADLSVRPGAMRAHLRALHRRGYRGTTFSEAVLHTAPHKRVAITFDDAFASVATLAKPILDGLGWPGTVFAVSGFAETGRPLHWEGVGHWATTEYASEIASLDWAGLRALADAGWEIGSHTVSHPHLTRLDAPDLRRELEDSRTAVERALDRPCLSIAYPYGDVDARVVEAVGRAGYTTGGGLPRRWHEDRGLDYPRVGAYQRDDVRRLLLKGSPIARRIRRAIGR